MSYCVYKLENDKGDLYFGMTKNPNKRWITHMSNARKNKSCSSKRLWYCDDAVVGMEELEMFETKEEAHEREKELIQNNNCVNTHTYDFDLKAHKKEYYQKNKEERKQKSNQYHEKNKEVINAKRKQNKELIKQKKREYHQKNKEQIAEQKKQKIVCDICGSTSSRGAFARHKKSAKCKSHLPTK